MSDRWILGLPQGITKLFAFTGAAVAGARIGQRWGDSQKQRRTHIAAGATALVLGTAASITARCLFVYDARGFRNIEHVWRTEIVLGESGGITAMLGVGYFARSVSRPRARHRGLVAFVPRHDGITLGYAGRF